MISIYDALASRRNLIFQLLNALSFDGECPSARASEKNLMNSSRSSINFFSVLPRWSNKISRLQSTTQKSSLHTRQNANKELISSLSRMKFNYVFSPLPACSALLPRQSWFSTPLVYVFNLRNFSISSLHLSSLISRGQLTKLSLNSFLLPTNFF